VSRDLLEIPEDRNREERHPNADIGRKLGTHTSHAFPGGPFPLVAFPLEDNDVAASDFREVISNAGANNAAPNDDYPAKNSPQSV
jgi:hypothetical protein